MFDFLKYKNLTLAKGDWPVLIGLLYMLVVNMPHTIAAQYLLSGLMFAVLIINIIKKGFFFERFSLSPIGLWFYALIAVCVLSTCLSPYFFESFSQVKKDAVPYFLAFAIFSTQSSKHHNRERLALKILQVTALAFVFRSAFAAWSFAENGFEASIYKSGVLPKYLDYYAIDSVLYIPIVMGVLLFMRPRRGLQICLAVSLIVALGIVFVSQIRTSFLLCFLTVGALLSLRFWESLWRKRVIVGVFLTALFIGAFVFRGEQSLARYQTIFDYQGYADKSKAMSGRYPIWLATMEIVISRPIIGYGKGWKKLPLVAEDLSLIQKWDQSGDELLEQAAQYFRLGSGVVNPHNLYLLVLFEVGSLGLLAFFGLLVAMLTSAVAILKSCKGAVQSIHFSVATIALVYLANYILLGITNATWFAGSFLAVAVSLSLLISKSDN